MHSKLIFVYKAMRKIGKFAKEYYPIVMAALSGVATVCAVHSATEESMDAVTDTLADTVKSYPKTLIFTAASIGLGAFSFGAAWKRSLYFKNKYLYEHQRFVAYRDAVIATSGVDAALKAEKFLAEKDAENIDISDKPEKRIYHDFITGATFATTPEKFDEAKNVIFSHVNQMMDAEYPVDDIIDYSDFYNALDISDDDFSTVPVECYGDYVWDFDKLIDDYNHDLKNGDYIAIREWCLTSEEGFEVHHFAFSPPPCDILDAAGSRYVRMMEEYYEEVRGCIRDISEFNCVYR